MSNFSFSDSDQALWLYHFDSTGVYIGSGLAMIPAGTGLPAKTTISPCNSPEGKTGIWNGESWDYVQDNRGVRYWNQYGSGTVIVAVDEVIPVDAILVEPPRKKDGFSLLFADGTWQQIENKTGQKYFGSLGEILIVDSPYFTLPDGYTFIEPPEPKVGLATQWSGFVWAYVKDYRGQTAYKTDTREPVNITEVGELSENMTFTPPATRFDEWDGSAWVTNKEAVAQNMIELARGHKILLREEADNEIAVLSDAVKYGLATKYEVTNLEAWSRYRVELMRVEPSRAPNIEWPSKP